jgi:flagellar hook assembly protein FlgD
MQVKVDKAGRVRVIVHDAAGQQVRRLVDDDLDARALFLSWDGRNDRGEAVATGVYFVSAAVPGGKTRVRRLAVIR